MQGSTCEEVETIGFNQKSTPYFNNVIAYSVGNSEKGLLNRKHLYLQYGTEKTSLEATPT